MAGLSSAPQNQAIDPTNNAGRTIEKIRQRSNTQHAASFHAATDSTQAALPTAASGGNNAPIWTLTLSSEDSRSLAMSASDGNPPAVTSDAKVNVQ
jgi:hypothetical protein